MVNHPPAFLINLRRAIASTWSGSSAAQVKSVLDVIEPYIAAREAEAAAHARAIEIDAVRLEAYAAAVQACEEVARKKTQRGWMGHAGVVAECVNAIREIKP